ncbi:hypothetical protein Syun_020472 [Stephania yunnanensis]|uniref:FYVE-type domain-containing protein n=1 Tax=Stephania yunnanensis TaxID=152371 RepID=A0AAP0IE91_9MAGN
MTKTASGEGRSGRGRCGPPSRGDGQRSGQASSNARKEVADQRQRLWRTKHLSPVGEHHCRNCGDIFCDKCTHGRIALTADENAQPVRVCDKYMMMYEEASQVANDAIGRIRTVAACFYARARLVDAGKTTFTEVS